MEIFTSREETRDIPEYPRARRDVCYPYFYLFLLREDGRLAIISSELQKPGQ